MICLLLLQGFIHKVEADEIFLKFDNQFHLAHRDRNQYDVSFTYNRLNMRRLYKAIHEAELLGPDILFPCRSSSGSVKKGPFKPLNPHMVAPYVIYGPPGTGRP
jgi:helicase MOV-10